MTAKKPANPASRTLFDVLAARGLTVSAVARAAAISEGTLRAYRDTEGRGLNTRTLHKVIGAIAQLSGSPAPPELAAPDMSGAEIVFPAGASPAVGRAPPGLASPAAREYTAPELVPNSLLRCDPAMIVVPWTATDLPR